MPKDVKKKIIIEVDDKGDLKRTKKKIDDLNKSTNRASKGSMEYNRNMKGLSKQSSNTSKNFSKTAQGMQGVLVPAYAEVAARVFALSAAFHALSKAADYAILIQGQEAYARMTGKNMGAIARSVQEASKHMLDFKEASTSVALATTSGISSKQIVAMTKAAVDSSSALGRSVTDTMDRLTRGIVKAEPEILDEIGVIIRLDKVYKDYAEKLKTTTAELTEGEKATARYNAIMGQLEDKFGGISDTLDPNYFAALSATVLDIINKVASFGVTWLGGPLKFLTESKTLIVAIMALILKSIGGKIFPALTGLGAKLTEMPAKMAARNKILSASIKKLRADIAGSAAEVDKFNKLVGRKGQKETAGMTDARSKGDIDKYSRLQKAALKRAQTGLGGDGRKRVKGGIYAGMNLKELAVVEKQTKSLDKIQTNWHSKQRIELKKHGISLKQLQLGYRNAKMGAAKFAAQQVQLMNLGVRAGIRQIGANWKSSGTLASIALNTMKAGISGVTVAVRALGAAINWAFKAFMAITIAWSVIKGIASLWMDFDKPFKKAAQAAGEMNEELKKSLDSLNERPQNINFDGMAGNFNEALKNASFAANLADEIYNATSAAMKKINNDLAKMGWLDKLLDKVKGALRMTTFKDELADSLISSIKLAQEMGATLPTGVQGVLAQDRTVGQTWEDSIKALTQSQLITYLGETDKMFDNFAVSTKTYNNNMVELGQTFNKVSKYSREYAESLVSKTEYYDLAKTQQKLQNLFKLEDLSKADKILAAVEGGYIAVTETEGLGKLLSTYKEVSELSAKYDAGHLNQTEEVKKDVKDKLKIIRGRIIDMAGGMFTDTTTAATILGFNAIEAQETALKAQTDKLALDHESKALAIFGNYALERQSEIKEAILKQEIKSIEDKIAAGHLDDAALANAEEQLRLKNIDLKVAGATALKQAEHEAKIEGRKLSILEKYVAMRMDLYRTHAEGPGGQYMSEAGKTELAILENQKEGEIETFFTKYIEGLDKSIKLTRLLTEWTENFGEASKQQQADTIEAQKYALRNTSYAGMALSPKMREEALKDSDGVNLGTSHKKLSREIEFKNQDRAYRKHKVLLDLEFKLADIKDKRISEELKLLHSKWAVEMELMKAQEAERDAIWKERAATFGAAMNKVAQSFGSAVGTYFNDIFMNKKPEEGAFRNTLAQGFAGAGSGMIAGAAQKQVFGNKGFVAGMFRNMGMGDDWIDTLFPQTELEMAKERTSYLKDIRDHFINGGVVPGAGDILGTSSVSSVIENITEDLTEGLTSTVSTITSLITGQKWSRPELVGGEVGTNLVWTALANWITGKANGGVVSGGFRAFANGGVANKPTLGMIGEGKYNEAVVPLPDGKSIPVVGAGGNNNNVTVNVAIDSDGKSKAEVSGGGNAKELGYLVSQAVQSELVEQQRPGGLLSAY